MTTASLHVSVIIPAYNAESTILDSLNSIYDQTIKPQEIIVIDDGSTDNTRHLVEDFIKHNTEYTEISIISLSQNHGPSYSRNEGVGIAKGDWVLFLDADDRWSRHRVEKLREFISKNRGAKFVFCKYIRDSSVLPNFLLRIIICLNRSIVPRWLLFFKSFIATPAVALRKDVIGAGFPCEIRHCEDLDLWLRISQKYKIHFQNEPLSFSGPVRNQVSLSSDKDMMKLMTTLVLRRHAVNCVERMLCLIKSIYFRVK